MPLGGRGGRIGRGGCSCGGGASPRLKKLLEISTGGGGKAVIEIIAPGKAIHYNLFITWFIVTWFWI